MNSSGNQTATDELAAPISLLDASMHPWTMQQTLGEIARRMDAGIFTQHVVVNVAKVVNMRRDSSLRDSVRECDIINIDGMGVVWGARIMGFQVPERVAGVDLFHKLLQYAEQDGKKVFLLGAKKDVIDETARRVQYTYPGLKIAGHHHGYFWDDEEAVVRKIASSGADMLFVAITSPRKEQFIHRWRNQLGVNFAMGVGGTFDIVAGKSRRAPVWMQKSGLEWLYRIIQEPRRMWKRYLVTNSKYMFLLVREWIACRLLHGLKRAQ
ncbi:MAG: WecB/TagA/CpsF family glycosyltransferase [Mariprofundaceae bacterium]|nr:WecB/TagA/CpsF family glycosyltransferase [Mariprofundaceae bacterium]